MADQTLAKFVNERSILTLLKVKGKASRAEISRSLGLTQATISRLTSAMIKRGLLREVATAPPDMERDPGRPGIAIEIDPHGAYFIGAEVGVSVLRVVLLDLCASVVESKEIRLTRKLSPKEAATAISKEINRFCKKSTYGGRITGVGVTVPGLVTDDGFVVNLPILGWKNTDFRLNLKALTSLPVTIENNANAAAFGAVYTLPKLVAPFTLFLKLGTGCGGAAIINGRLMRGAYGTGLEVGHMKIRDTGQVCSCGQRGCLEILVNLAALNRAWIGKDAVDHDLDKLPEEVGVAYDQGNSHAVTAVLSIARCLSDGLVSLINIFNPAQIVLGGAMVPVLRRALREIESIVAERIIPGTRAPEILTSQLGPFECAIGAACISHHMIFDVSISEISGVFNGS